MKTLYTHDKIQLENLNYYVGKSFQICFNW